MVTYLLSLSAQWIAMRAPVAARVRFWTWR